MARVRTYADAYYEKQLLRRRFQALGKQPEELPKTRDIFDGEYERALLEDPGRISRIFIGNVSTNIYLLLLGPLARLPSSSTIRSAIRH